MAARDWRVGNATVLQGDCRTRLQRLPDSSIDALLTDPPAGIAFMGAAWDTFRARGAFVAFMTDVAAECLRVLKPGAHGLVWAIPRTSHWTATALEDAGFEVRDIVHHHFGSGFPKSLDVSKAIDRAAGAERQPFEVGPTVRRIRPGADQIKDATWEKLMDRTYTHAVTVPATDAARRWEGWGTGLKPATEHWILVRKPLAGPNVASNVLEHGTGAINVDGCRVGPGERAGRWPANVVLSHSEACRPAGLRQVRSNSHYANGRGANGVIRTGLRSTGVAAELHVTAEQTERWECGDGCPVAELDRQSGCLISGFLAAGTPREGLGYHGGLGSRVRNDTYGDRGGASRFFYVAKPNARERSAGLPRGVRNPHPTVKSIALMRYLCRLITPPAGVVLDPFLGSGSTGIAATLEGFGFIGIERDPRTVRIAVARLRHWLEDERHG